MVALTEPASHQPVDGSAARRTPQVALWVFVGVVAVLLVGSIVVVNVLRPSSARAAGPTDVVRSYLEALAAGDATKALSYAVSPPADQSLLTDAVLAESMRRAPMSDIQVSQDPGVAWVKVSDTLGGKDYDDEYTPVKVGASYKLDRVTASVYLTSIIDKFPILVNGTPLTNENAEVFPVTHVVTTGLPNVDWGDDATLVGAVHSNSRMPVLRARITKAGQQAFVSGARKRLGACLAQHRLAPASCPFGFNQPSSGPRVKESTVRWTVKGNPWAKLAKPDIDSFVNQGAAKASTTMTFTVTCRFSNGDGCRPENDTEKVTFAGDLTTNPMKVVLTTF